MRSLVALSSLWIATVGAQPLPAVGTETRVKQPWKSMADVSEGKYLMALYMVSPKRAGDVAWQACPRQFAVLAQDVCDSRLLPDLTQKLELPRETCIVLWILRSHTACVPRH